MKDIASQIMWHSFKLYVFLHLELLQTRSISFRFSHLMFNAHTGKSNNNSCRIVRVYIFQTDFSVSNLGQC